MSEATLTVSHETPDGLLDLLARTEKPLRLGLGLACVLVAATFLVIVVAHIRDRFYVRGTAGVYLAMADHARHGTLYPNLFDGQRYGGSRYMPLAFLPYAGMAALTGDYLLGGKLLSCATALLLCVQVCLVLRRSRCEPLLMGAMLGLLLTSDATFEAFVTTRGDLLPMVFQLGALLLATRAPTTARCVGAAGLCTLALFTKVTAVWAGLALICYLFSRDRRRCVLFVVAWVGGSLLLLGLFQWLSSGRMLANLAAMSFPDQQGLLTRLFRTVNRFKYYTTSDMALPIALVPALLVSLLLAVRSRCFTVYHWGLFWFLPILAVVWTDLGAYGNHVLDLVVLGVVLAGMVWARTAGAGVPRGALRSGILLVLLWALLAGWATRLLPHAGWLLSPELQTEFSPRPLAAMIGPGDRILSEDPLIEVSRDQRPNVLDAYAYARMAEHHLPLTQHLLRRIENQEFDWIVTLQPLSFESPGRQGLHFDLHWGPEAAETIRKHYVFKARAEGYYVMVPRVPGDIHEERCHVD